MESVAYTSDHKETTSADASHHLTPTILEVKKQQISQVNVNPRKVQMIRQCSERNLMTASLREGGSANE